MTDIFKALADPTRRAILAHLRERALSAGEIAERFPQSRPTLSGHFAVLHAAGLVSRDRRGSTIVYRLRLSVLEEAWLGLASALRLGPAHGPATIDAPATIDTKEAAWPANASAASGPAPSSP